MSASVPATVSALKAAGEPTRMRMLALLSRAELTVGEICEVLKQSQPRVSRHLKVLSSAGLLDRFREEHWVYYRAPTHGEGSNVVRTLLGLADQSDLTFVRDRQRMERVIAERARGAADESATAAGSAPEWIETLITHELEGRPIGALLDVGTGSGHLLEALAPRATRAVGVDISSNALRLARTNVHGAGLGHCELQQGSMYDLPFDVGTFDTVTMDRLLASAERPLLALAELARAMKAGGRALIIEDFDSLHDAVNANPITTLRQWLSQSGFECKRIHPLDTESRHLLVAVGERVDTAKVAA